jgi:hypothetical protein
MSDQEEKAAASRFVLSVPTTDAKLSMGKPSPAFGYPGISLSTQKCWFLDITDSSVFQHGGKVTHLGSSFYTFFVKKDLVMSAAGGATVASKRVLMLAAGPGYMEDAAQSVGNALHAPTYNLDDLDDLIEPALNGVKAFDDASRAADVSFDAAMGAVPQAAVVQAQQEHARSVAARAVSAIAGIVSKGLVGGHPHHTKNSLYISEFMYRGGGLLGLLSAAVRKLDQLDKWLSRPQAIPIVGDVLALQGKVKSALALAKIHEPLVHEATEALELAKLYYDRLASGTALTTTKKHIAEKRKKIRENKEKIEANATKLRAIEANKPALAQNREKAAANRAKVEQLRAEAKANPEEASKSQAEIVALELETKALDKAYQDDPQAGPLVAESEKLTGENEKLTEEVEHEEVEVAALQKNFAAWEKSPDWKGKLGTDVDLVKLMRPARRLARAVREVTYAVAEIVEQIVGFLGLEPPPPSALGLVAKHGISMITGDRVFGFASDGFHFVSAESPKPTGKLASLRAAIKNAKKALPPALSNFLFGREPSRPSPSPGFFVETAGPVRLRSFTEVQLDAYQPGGNVSARARGNVELTADLSARISARNGNAWLTGARVSLGIPMMLTADTKTLLAKKMLLPAYDALRKQADDANVAYEAARKPLLEKRAEIEALREENARAGNDAADPLVAARNEEIAALEPALPPLEVATIAPGVRRLAAQQALAALVDRVSQLEVIASEPRSRLRGAYQNARNQKLTAVVDVVAAKEINAYTPGKVELHGKEVSIKAEDTAVPATPQTPPATIDASAIGVTLKVGDWEVKVTPTNVVISKTGAGANPKVTIDATGILLDASTGDIKMKSTAAGINAKTCDINGDSIRLG